MSRSHWRTVLAAAMIGAMITTTPAVAQNSGSSTSGAQVDEDATSTGNGSVQPGSMESGSSTGDAFTALLRTILAGSSGTSSATNGSSLTTLLELLPLVGSSEFRLSSGMVLHSADYPKPIDESITTPEIVDRVPEEGNRLERWTVASPSMARNVEVQVMLPADPNEPAPMLYLLDGVDAHRNSDWTGAGRVGEFFDDKNVTLVMPTEAHASMYSDWMADDPHLGRHMWETFLTEELPPLLEAEPELNFNGKRGIGGLSMGATGAVHLANTHPEMFNGVFGLSGCYSTMDEVGRQTAHLTVSSRGGDIDNMWGPFGSEEWERHDTVRNPEGLRDMAVYLSSANGEYLFNPERDYSNVNPTTMTTAILLEQGSHICTRNLEQAMEDAGMNHQVVEYTGAGVHNWANFRPQIDAAWNTIRDELY